MNLSYDNYIFDVYGTLIDLETDEVSAKNWKKWCRFLDNKGIKHPVYYQFRNDFFQMDKRYRKEELAKGNCIVPEIDILEVYAELFDQYGNGKLSIDTLNEISYAFRENTRSYLRLYPGVEEYIKQLKVQGKKVYILSNAQASYTRPELTMFHLDEMVDGFLLSSDYKKMKPDSGFFREIIQTFSLNIEKTVMIGDSFTSDICGAKGVGIDGIHLKGDNRAEVFYINELKG